MEEEMQTITLPPAVVNDLKETAWQLDMSVPELMSLILLEETHKQPSTKEELDQQVKEGWKQLRQTISQKPQKVLGNRRRKVRTETPEEDGHWVPAAGGLLTLSLPIPKFRRDKLREMGQQRGISQDEEAARILQEAVRNDYKPRSEAEWAKEQDATMSQLGQVWRDIFRSIWSGGKRR